MGIFFKKKKIIGNVKTQEEVSKEKTEISVSTINQLPKEFSISSILFAYNTQSEIAENDYALEATTYRTRTTETGETVYDILVLTGDNAKKLYSNISQDKLYSRVKGGLHHWNLELDDLLFCGLQRFGPECRIEQIIKELPLQTIFKTSTISLEKLTTIVNNQNEIKKDTNKSNIVNKLVWEEIDNQK